MKKYLLVLVLFVAAISGCKKDVNQAEKDDADIQAYIKANNITDVIKDASGSGLYYKIVTPGAGGYPNASSTVTVNYTGKFLSGNQFDAGNGITFPLSGVITGWTIGLQRIQTGGRILLLVPSALGYGSSDNGPIPKNSVLVFNIDLLSIK